MPTVAEVLNRSQPSPPPVFYTGRVVSAVAGTGVTVELDGGAAAAVLALRLNSAAYVANDRVLVLRHRTANYVLGKITP